MRIEHVILFISMFLVFSNSLRAQDTVKLRPTSLEEIFRLTVLNSYRLKISAENVNLARQQVVVSKAERLPSASSDLRYGYISNSDIWNPSFTDHRTAEIPHHYTLFSTQAAAVIFKGGEIRNTIKRSDLEQQVAVLADTRNMADVKFLAAAKYLDIFTLMSQRQVYINNIKLTQNRLKNILTMQRQGMVTQNDVLRTKLIISDFELSLRRANNDIVILNDELNVITGLPDSSRIVPDSTLLSSRRDEQGLPYFEDLASRENQELRIAATNNIIAETDIKLVGSDRLPQLSLYALTNLQRPFTNTLPVTDIYTNVWQAGMSIHYNIASLYQTRKRVKIGQIALAQSKDREILEKQNLETDIKAGFIKYKESIQDLATLTEDRRSAEENYRVVEKKYFNQLALLTDMIDATNTKIEAELKVTTAQINVIYKYYQLLNTIGTL